MTKAELLNALKGIDDAATIYLHVDGFPHNVECTEVEDYMVSEDEPIAVLS